MVNWLNRPTLLVLAMRAPAVLLADIAWRQDTAIASSLVQLAAHIWSPDWPANYFHCYVYARESTVC